MVRLSNHSESFFSSLLDLNIELQITAKGQILLPAAP